MVTPFNFAAGEVALEGLCSAPHKAEFERELIAERTHAGLVAARARERRGGRPRKMDRATVMMAMTAMADSRANAAEVARRLNITTTTLYAYVNGDGTLKQAGQALLRI